MRWDDILIICVGLFGFAYESFGQPQKQVNEQRILRKSLGKNTRGLSIAGMYIHRN